MNSAINIIRDEIEKQPVSFTRFMELALYAPEVGYYERQREIGPRGDFFTSVSVGPLLGELLAFQFAEWFENESVDQAQDLRIIECGAHSGKLAANVLSALQSRHPHAFSKVEYCILEPSPVHQEWQADTLSTFRDRVRWVRNWSQFASAPDIYSRYTIIFANELLDAMPAYRLRWNSRLHKWEEMKVGWDGCSFVWIADDPSPELQIHLPVVAEELKPILPDRYTIEVSLAAMEWWQNACNLLRHGKLIAIDYGLTDDELFLPQRSNGTLRAYYRHHLSADLLANAGEQDITAHVNFSALQKIGADAGLISRPLVSQRKFLTEIAARMWKRPEQFSWDQDRTRQFQTLTHEEHLGRSFRVLVQDRR